MVLKDRINENDQYKITDKSMIQIIKEKNQRKQWWTWWERRWGASCQRISSLSNIMTLHSKKKKEATQLMLCSSKDSTILQQSSHRNFNSEPALKPFFHCQWERRFWFLYNVA